MNPMKTFNLDGYDYQAEDCIQGILVNPLLPDNFWTEPLVDRSDDEMGRWEEFPFILMEWEGMKKVYILDGGAWDRPTLRFASNDFNEVMKYLHDNNYIQFQDSQLTHKTMTNHLNFVIKPVEKVSHCGVFYIPVTEHLREPTPNTYRPPIKPCSHLL